MIHALDRAAGSAKLSSVGLCLNASNAISSVVKGGSDISRSLVSRKAQNNVTLLGDQSTNRTSHKPDLPYSAIARRRDLTATPNMSFASSISRLGIICRRFTWQGDVLDRAITMLRSVETQPSAWRFVLSDGRDPTQDKNTKAKQHAA